MPSTEADRLIVNPAFIDEDHLHVVAAIIWKREDKHQLLIAQRQKGKHLQDYWEFPGGKLEAGESRWQALQRELEEELQIQATRGKPYMQVYYRYPLRNVLLDVWVVEDYCGEVASGEQQLLRWIEVSQIDDYQYPPADIPVIEAIKSSATTEIRRFP
jgi:8-oxo-dGTP diphosphatase